HPDAHRDHRDLRGRGRDLPRGAGGIQASTGPEPAGRGSPDPLRPRRRVQGDGTARRGDRRVPEGAAFSAGPVAHQRGAGSGVLRAGSSRRRRGGAACRGEGRGGGRREDRRAILARSRVRGAGQDPQRVAVLRAGARSRRVVPRRVRTDHAALLGARLMTVQGISPVSLDELQEPVRARLARVDAEMRRMIEDDFPLITDVNRHLLRMRGKMLRPTLVLLADEAAGEPSPQAETLAAVIELIHLATLVHDDSVDHSTLRRGMPTINALFSHQVSVIMGDFLYSRAVVELVRFGSLDILEVLARVTNEMTIGEMRQLLAHDPLAFTEDQYDLLIRAKTASLLSGACEVGGLNAPAPQRAALARFGERLGMAFQIIDDLLDYTALSEDTGKPSGLDLREHKVTLPLIHALPRMSAGERKLVSD